MWRTFSNGFLPIFASYGIRDVTVDQPTMEAFKPKMKALQLQTEGCIRVGAAAGVGGNSHDLS
eukprot:668625-Rhodomonas_salina.1